MHGVGEIDFCFAGLFFVIVLASAPVLSARNVRRFSRVRCRGFFNTFPISKP
jgi:hypothetical protein